MTDCDWYLGSPATSEGNSSQSDSDEDTASEEFSSEFLPGTPISNGTEDRQQGDLALLIYESNNGNGEIPAGTQQMAGPEANALHYFPLQFDFEQLYWCARIFGIDIGQMAHQEAMAPAVESINSQNTGAETPQVTNWLQSTHLPAPPTQAVNQSVPPTQAVNNLVSTNQARNGREWLIERMSEDLKNYGITADDFTVDITFGWKYYEGEVPPTVYYSHKHHIGVKIILHNVASKNATVVKDLGILDAQVSLVYERNHTEEVLLNEKSVVSATGEIAVKKLSKEVERANDDSIMEGRIPNHKGNFSMEHKSSYNDQKETYCFRIQCSVSGEAQILNGTVLEIISPNFELFARTEKKPKNTNNGPNTQGPDSSDKGGKGIKKQRKTQEKKKEKQADAAQRTRTMKVK